MQQRILFVDDEPLILEGIRSLLRPWVDCWDVVYVTSAAAGLAELEAKPVDIVVSDLRMPLIDGIAFLRSVQQRFPRTIRIILSGQAELDVALEGLAVAHQFLGKPCDEAVLVRTLELALAAARRIEDKWLAGALGALERLPLLSRSRQALDGKPAASFLSLGGIAKIAADDPAACASIMQLASSTLFGPTALASVDVDDAVQKLDAVLLRRLVVRIAAESASWDQIAFPLADLNSLHRHIWTAKEIAWWICPSNLKRGEVATLALLCDIGLLAQVLVRPHFLERVFRLSRSESRPLHTVETELGGTTHCEIGAYLLGIWGLPESIIEVVAHHHSIDPPTSDQLKVADVLYLADALASSAASEAGDREVYGVLAADYASSPGVCDRLPLWQDTARNVLRSWDHGLT